MLDAGEIKVDFKFYFLLFWRWICSCLLTLTTKIFEKKKVSTTTLKLKDCVGNNGNNFFSFFLVGMTVMIGVQFSQESFADDNRQVVSPPVLRDDDPNTKLNKKKNKKGSTNRTNPMAIRFIKHILDQVVIANVCIEVIAEIPAKDDSNNNRNGATTTKTKLPSDASNKNDIHVLTGISLGLDEFRIQSGTTFAPLSSDVIADDFSKGFKEGTSSISVCNLNMTCFCDMSLNGPISDKNMVNSTTREDIFRHFPTLLSCPANEIISLALSGLTALLTYHENSQEKSDNVGFLFPHYEILSAVMFSSSGNTGNINIEYWRSQINNRKFLPGDIEVRCGVENFAFFIDLILPSVTALAQESRLIKQQIANTSKSTRQQHGQKNASEPAKQSAKHFFLSTPWLPKEAYIACGFKFNIMDKAISIRPQQSDQMETSVIPCCDLEAHTFVSGSFSTRPESSLNNQTKMALPSSSSSLLSSTTDGYQELAQNSKEATALDFTQLDDCDNGNITKCSNTSLVQILSISCSNTFVRIVNGPNLLWLEELDIEFCNHILLLPPTDAAKAEDSVAVSSFHATNTSVADQGRLIPTKLLLFIHLGLVKARIELCYLHILKKLPSFPKRQSTKQQQNSEKGQKLGALITCPIECHFNCFQLDVVLVGNEDKLYRSVESQRLSQPFQLSFFGEALQMDLLFSLDEENRNNTNEGLQLRIECSFLSEVFVAAAIVTPPTIPLMPDTSELLLAPAADATIVNNDPITTIIGLIREFSGNISLNNRQPEGKGCFHAREVLIQECDYAIGDISSLAKPQLDVDSPDCTATVERLTTVAMVQFVKCELNPLLNQNEIQCNVEIDGKVIGFWHALLQWKIASIEYATKAVLHDLQNFIKKKSSSSSMQRSISKTKKPSIYVCLHTQKSIELNAILGNGNTVRVALHGGTELNITTLSSRRKPDVSVSARHCTLFMNDLLPEVATVEDIVFRDCFRVATESEIFAYNNKKDLGAVCLDISDDLVADLNGSPLFESVHLTASNVIFRVAPELHFGQVLDDFEKTMKGLQIGLGITNLKKQPAPKCYQLMSIRSTFMRVDASILEADVLTKKSHRCCHRFRVIFRLLDVSVDRLNPPSHRKAQLNVLDEDPSEFREYGPPVQGGYIMASIQKVIVLVDPLTLAVPLAVLQDLNWKGTAMIAGLSPQSFGLFGGRKAYVPIFTSNSCFDSNLRRQYGFEAPFKGIPTKFYLDGALEARELSVNFGIDVQAVTPQIISAIDRLKPPSPNTESSAPSLGWWDSLRFFIHGQFSCNIHKIRLRWLLDSTSVPEWSIMIQSKGFRFHHSVGSIVSQFTSLVVSVPRDSYPLHSFDTTVLDASRSGLRHSLILVPVVNLRVTYNWSVLSSETETSSPLQHHSPYQSSSGTVTATNDDKFYFFRSHGVSICLKCEISVGAIFSNWIALRIDVLPWLTHNGHRFAELSRTKDHNKTNKKPAPKLDLNRIDATVSMSDLKVAVWHGPLDIKGVCLIITGAALTRVDGRFSALCSNKNELHLGRVQAVLLDVPHYEDALSFNSVLDGRDAVDLAALDKYDQISALLGSSHEVVVSLTEHNFISATSSLPPIETTEEETIFYALKNHLEKTCAVDYLVEVSSLVLLEQSLTKSFKGIAVDFLTTKDASMIPGDSSNFSPERGSTMPVTDQESALEKEERTWTVLVSGMKLLWTIDIRDAVVLLVGDFMRTSELMKLQLKVSSRGSKTAADVNKNVQGERHALGLGHCEEDSSAAENSIQLDEPKSSLLRLLESFSEDDEIMGKSSRSVENPSEMGNLGYNGFEERDDTSIESDANPSFPILVVHLFNPQIQLHSEHTGGGIILAMRGCYVEGRQFYKYFADYSFDRSDCTLNEVSPKVLRKREFLYQLDEVEAFAVDAEVDVDIGLQWLELGDTVDVDSGGKAPPAPLESCVNFDSCSPRYFLCEATMRKIIKSFSFRTRQLFFRQPLDLSPDEIGVLFSSESIIKVGGPFGCKVSVMDSVQVNLDQLSFELDSYQFSTTSDLIKNVILAPPPMPRKLPVDTLKAPVKNQTDIAVEESDDGGFHEVGTVEKLPLTGKTSKLDACDDSDSSISSNSDQNSESEFENKESYHISDGEAPPNQDELQRILLGWRESQHRKRDRDMLRIAVQNLLSFFEEQQSDSRLIRYIEWSLSKASWKIYSPDVFDDVEIELTSLRGTHQFSSDSSMTTQLELEDLRINSLKPSADAMNNFAEPGSVLTTSLGAERTPCQRCGATFDRASNYTRSCRFHGHDYGSVGQYLKSQGSWSCCGASSEGAPGCKTSPHTGRERVALVRVESLPKIKGISLYKHVEINIYPEVPHTLVVQMTKNVSKLFVSYFIGDSAAGKGSTKQGVADVQHSKHLGDDDKSDISVSLAPVPTIEKSDSMKKKSNLFSKQQTFLRKGNSSVPVIETCASSDCDDREALASCKKEEEIVFVKHLRIGNINTEISLVGFPIETRQYGIGVPAFTRAYKIGTNSYLSRKYVSHVVHEVVKSVAHSGLTKVSK